MIATSTISARVNVQLKEKAMHIIQNEMNTTIKSFIEDKLMELINENK